MAYQIFTDGASRGNPGKASYGFVIYEDAPHSPIYTEAMALGIKTNNEAEYIAVYRAMKKLSELPSQDTCCYLDSELVVKQITGKYKVKKPELRDIYLAILDLLRTCPVSFVHVPREKNKMADALANYALDHSATPGTVYKNILPSL